jgi:hypothetical protein
MLPSIRTLINASDSRAGLYIKNMEPGIPSDSSEYILLLRGFPGIGREENGIALHSQWKMEFNVSDADYFHKPFSRRKGYCPADLTPALLEQRLDAPRFHRAGMLVPRPDRFERACIRGVRALRLTPCCSSFPV